MSVVWSLAIIRVVFGDDCNRCEGAIKGLRKVEFGGLVGGFILTNSRHLLILYL